jgi:transcriptional regulator with XRE-family HTH domain
MATVERVFDRGRRRADRLRRLVGNDLRDARLSHGLSQGAVAEAVRISAPKLSRIENGRLETLSIEDAALVAAAVGLELTVRAYPGGAPVRDAAQAPRLGALLRAARPPLVCRTEVVLPARGEFVEQRAWDATISDGREVMGVEYEARLYDVQAQMRRFELKIRDGAVNRSLLVIADTRTNRRVLREFAEYFAKQPRMPARLVREFLAAGRLPPGGLTLL